MTELGLAARPRQIIRLVLVDDHVVFRAGLRELLSKQPDCVVVGEAGTGEEAVARVKEARPDVVLMDLAMPGEGGLAARREDSRSHGAAAGPAAARRVRSGCARVRRKNRSCRGADPGDPFSERDASVPLPGRRQAARVTTLSHRGPRRGREGRGRSPERAGAPGAGPARGGLHGAGDRGQAGRQPEDRTDLPRPPAGPARAAPAPRGSSCGSLARSFFGCL